MTPLNPSLALVQIVLDAAANLKPTPRFAGMSGGSGSKTTTVTLLLPGVVTDQQRVAASRDLARVIDWATSLLLDIDVAPFRNHKDSGSSYAVIKLLSPEYRLPNEFRSLIAEAEFIANKAVGGSDHPNCRCRPESN